jgi:phenylacetate-coenzyme A ligase PaaK-like adenylate-forming protein
MAVSCDKNCGMHIIENRSFITFVDPETKEEVSEGENGIDLVTTLYDIEERPGTILLNYSHGDVSEVLSFDECECGRTFKRIEHPSRQDEMVSVRGVKLCPRDVEPLLARLTDYFTGEYVAIYEFDEITRAPSLEIRLEAKKEIPGHIYSCLPNDVLAELFKSNPAALSVMFPQDIKTSVVRKGELYKGLDVKPSKPRRLIKIETNL